MPGKAFTSRAPGEGSLGSIAEGTTRAGAAGDHFGAVYGHEFAESIEHPAQHATFDPSSSVNAAAGDRESWAAYWTQQGEVTAAEAASAGRQGGGCESKGESRRPESESVQWAADKCRNRPSPHQPADVDPRSLLARLAETRQTRTSPAKHSHQELQARTAPAA
jgi:hypothetical protein